MEKRVNYLIDQFKKEFKDAPSDIFSSPGRIELCGNHTDHNNGKVLVSSIDLNILAAVRKREDNVISFISAVIIATDYRLFNCVYKKFIKHLWHIELSKKRESVTIFTNVPNKWGMIYGS